MRKTFAGAACSPACASEKELIYIIFFLQQLNGKYLAIYAAKIYCFGPFPHVCLVVCCVHTFTFWCGMGEAIIYCRKFAADFPSLSPIIFIFF